MHVNVRVNGKMVYFSFGHSTLVACHFVRVQVQELLLQYVDAFLCQWSMVYANESNARALQCTMHRADVRSTLITLAVAKLAMQ